MSEPKSGRRIVWLRRGVQAVCLLLFFHLLLDTRVDPASPAGDWHKLYFVLNPLALLSTWMSSHAVPLILLFSLVTVTATLLFGRVFCGWVCPLGTIHAMFSALRNAPRKILIQTEQFTGWHKGKYYLLACLLAMGLLGVHWSGIFDPISLLVRSCATGLLPSLQFAIENGANLIYQADPHIGTFHLTSISEPVYRFSKEHLFTGIRPTFHQGPFLLFLLLLIAVLNLLRKRFWCRYLCPLGAMLGLLAQRPLFRLVTQPESCGGCSLCVVNCQGGALPNKPDEHLPSECFVCWNCIPQCSRKAVSFEFVRPVGQVSTGRLDLSKRAFMAAGLVGVSGVFMARLTPESQGKTFHPSLIRPPGSLPENEFLEKCLQCGLCMKACPTSGLQPAFLEAGWQGLWSPLLYPAIGYCEYGCNLCGQVCPTGAIQPLTLEEKRNTRIGLAAFDTTRCLPYAYDRNCIICEEHCPTPHKAIYFTEKEITARDGRVLVLKQPRVDPNLCIGCGICETKCVFKDRPAIRVSSANETRNSQNQPILVGSPDMTPAPLSTIAPDPMDDPYGIN